jgi:lipoate-protein ligase A
MTTLEAVLGRRPSFAETAAALAGGFADAHALELAEGVLDAEESGLAEALARDKYSTDHWTRTGSPS